MNEPLPDGGTIRKLWIGETDAYRDHLLRLDRDSRHRRFSGAVSDDFIARHAATANEHGRRGARLLRRRHAARRRRVAADRPAVRARGGSRLQHRAALAEPRRGNRTARAHAARPRATAASNRCTWTASPTTSACSSSPASSTPSCQFDFGSVVGEVDPPRSTPLSLMREAHGRQSRRRHRDVRGAVAPVQAGVIGLRAPSG